MNSIKQAIWTREMNNETITIDPTFQLTILSMTLTAGTGTIQGSGLAGAVASNVVNLVVGQSVTISSDGINPLGTFVITTTGTLALIGK
jgi:hypothetical protein